MLFSGDLVQKGTEYAQLEDIFGKIWDCFRKLDCNPKLLAVPGNHDLPSPVGTTGCSQGRQPNAAYFRIFQQMRQDRHRFC